MTCQEIQEKLARLFSAREEFIREYEQQGASPSREAAAALIGQSEAIRSLINEIEGSLHLSLEEFSGWLKSNNLESKLEGGDFEALLKKQEEFYRYGYDDFQLDRDQITVERRKLKAIKNGLETGCLNYPFVYAIGEQKGFEHKATEMIYVYTRFRSFTRIRYHGATEFGGGMTGYDTDEILKRYIPVTPDDFNPKQLREWWPFDVKRICEEKKQAPLVRPKMQLIFTDFRQAIPKDQKVVNEKGQILKSGHSFIQMIENRVGCLTPAQWLMLACQKKSFDDVIFGNGEGDANEWLMAVIENAPGKIPPVSVAMVLPSSSGLWFDVSHAHGGDSDNRWRVAVEC